MTIPGYFSTQPVVKVWIITQFPLAPNTAPVASPLPLWRIGRNWVGEATIQNFESDQVKWVGIGGNEPAIKRFKSHQLGLPSRYSHSNSRAYFNTYAHRHSNFNADGDKYAHPYGDTLGAKEGG